MRIGKDVDMIRTSQSLNEWLLNGRDGRFSDNVIQSTIGQFAG